MRSGLRANRILAGDRVTVAYGVLVAVYLVRLVGFQPLQIPGYLLIVAYDVVELAFPRITPYHSIGFPLFLYACAVVAAGLTRLGRPQSAGGTTAAVRQSLGGVCLLVGTASLAFGVVVGGPLVASRDNPTPLAITGATGVVLLAAGWGLLGRHRS